MSFYASKQVILDATDNGLRVLQWILPNEKVTEYAGKKKPIKARDEKTPSAIVAQNKVGSWCIIDFGDDMKPKDCFSFYMHYHGVDFYTALQAICMNFGIGPEKGGSMGVEWTDRPRTPKDKANTPLDLEYGEWNKELLEIMGKTTTQEAVDFMNLRPVKQYGFIKGQKVLIAKATQFYPIFIYTYEYKEVTFWKLYQPFSKEKKHRFRYFGTKPNNIVFGIDKVIAAIKKAKQPIKKQKIASLEEINEYIKSPISINDKDKLPKIIIVSGESDAVAVRSHSEGIYPVWLGSESMTLSNPVYWLIQIASRNLYNLPDLDATGLKQSKRTALLYLGIKNIELPEKLRLIKDSRGNSCKDIKDFLQHFSAFEFDGLMDRALNLKFWIELLKTGKDPETGEEKVKEARYDCSNVHLYLWLQAKGVFRIDAPHYKEGYEYIILDENTVIPQTWTQIADRVNNYLKGRSIKVHSMVTLRNAFLKTPQLKENSLRNLAMADISFDHATSKEQYFFFRNKTVHITAEGVSIKKKEDVTRYVWQEDVKDHDIIPTEKILIFTDKGEGNWGVKFNEKYKDHIFLQYLYNTSNPFWNQKTPLTEEQEAKIEQHIANKIYAMGYYCHGHRIGSRAFSVYSTDLLDVALGESAGGTGKSILMQAPQQLVNSHTENGKSSNLFTDKHTFGSMTKKHRGLALDDADRNFKFGNMFVYITGVFAVNPKTDKAWAYEPTKSPKIWINTNHASKDADGATERRKLYTGHSDYYHAQGEKYTAPFSPRDEFGKDMYEDFTKHEWNIFYNMLFESVEFQLKAPVKVNPPMEDITRRMNREVMGESFEDWAKEYFAPEAGNINAEILKEDALAAINGKLDKKYQLKSATFKKKIRAYCQDYGLIFNPKRLLNAKNIIERSNGGVTKEYIYIESTDLSIPEPSTEVDPF